MKNSFNICRYDDLLKLIIAKGDPISVVKNLIVSLQNVQLLTFEKCTEPYNIKKDTDILDICQKMNIKVS